MKRIFLSFFAIIPFLVFSQSPIKKVKYPSLLWEISGKGLQKPSYLFGTMHVSSKMAFHLADSFYIGIRNADIVALETNPESWQEDMNSYDMGNEMAMMRFLQKNSRSFPTDYMSVNTLKISNYDKKIERALYSSSSTVNNLLYRSYGNESSDFEEDTYLDMYIYQCGKKWGKKVAGVEKYGESMKLMQEAYVDAAKEKNKKERSYENNINFSNGKLQEAYRMGNLDWLDSINRYNSFSSAFDEKFLYKRNEIQANSIDSILRSKQSLFVGVGAAHLPGDRGVIEMLRSKGYTLRPVKMGERDSQHKSEVDKIRVPVVFATQTADDGSFSVSIPGKFYKYGDDPSLEQVQCADMANGSYYSVTRILTNAWMWGQDKQRVSKIVDSLLYENIPGKILTKTPITRNGYSGVDITNRTRRGDLQRYNIFITPFEVIIFKMSGTGDYIQTGEEAKTFFTTIQMKEYKNDATPTAWKKYSPSFGGFSVNLPHDPYVSNSNNWIFDAEDNSSHMHYRVVRTDIHNYGFVEEDSFDLGLLDESFKSSAFIDKQISRKQINYKGYPALDCQYKDKNGNLYSTRFIIQGPHYYSLIALGKNETPAVKNFFNSFEIIPFVYGDAKQVQDTSLHFTASTTYYPVETKDKLDMPLLSGLYGMYSEMADEMAQGVFRSKLVANDSTGEKVFVSFTKAPKYAFYKDSVELQKNISGTVFDEDDSSWIKRSLKNYRLPDKTQVWEAIVSDTGSSRMLWVKTFYKDGILFTLRTQGDTLSKASSFVQTFFDSFTPSDTLKGVNAFTKKTDLFFADFMSADSATHQQALKNLEAIDLEDEDFPNIRKAIAFVNWNQKDYIETKKSLIAKTGTLQAKAASDFLKQLFYSAGDTVTFQYVILESLLNQKTSYSYNVFRDIITNEPPVLNISGNNYNRYNPYMVQMDIPITYHHSSNSDGNFLDNLYDSLQLTKAILPDILPLINLAEYKQSIMQLLGNMVDSNMVKPKEYEVYLSKFLLEAKHELRRQAIMEKQLAIDKAEKEKSDVPDYYGASAYNEEGDEGNDDLDLYARLLLPFWKTNPAVQQVISQMLSSSDKKLRYNTFLQLLQNDKPVPDTLMNYFASLDDYRYQLYSDLKKMKMYKLFPVKYNNHLDLSKSRLISESTYQKPDTLLYLDKLSASLNGKQGLVYFYKYKNKKDDMEWKIASVGLVPESASSFEFEESNPSSNSLYFLGRYYPMYGNNYDITSLSDSKLDEEEPLAEQLNKSLKKILFSKRKSGRQFYTNDYDMPYGMADMYED